MILATVAVDPSAAGSGLIEAISGSNWMLVVGFGLMLAVWAVQMFVMPNVNTKALPYIAVGIAVLGAFTTALVDDPAQWLAAIVLGVKAGIMAAGTYGLLPGKVKDKMKTKVAEKK